MGITFNADLTANCLAWLNSKVTLKPDRLLEDARKGEEKNICCRRCLFLPSKMLLTFCQEPRKIRILRKVLLEMLNLFSK
jgi:hypothetical protein